LHSFIPSGRASLQGFRWATAASVFLLQSCGPVAGKASPCRKTKRDSSREEICSPSAQVSLLLWWSEWLFPAQSSCVRGPPLCLPVLRRPNCPFRRGAVLYEPTFWRCHLALCLMQTSLKRVQQVQVSQGAGAQGCQNAFWHWTPSKQKHPQWHRTKQL